MKKKLISIITPCFNEEENARQLYERVKEIMSDYKQYDYEHIFIDNSSNDKTVEILKEIAKKDKNVKIIVNSRNFGHIRSPYHALLQSNGDAAMTLAADFQEPPELIREFIKKWEEGYKVVLGIKKSSKESLPLYLIRKIYYRIIYNLSEIKLEKDYGGFGFYDKKIIDILKEKYNDPYPYLRGIICEIGFERARIYYVQPRRYRGITKNNFYTLYDIAILGITSHSKIPLRIATFFGFFFSITGFTIGLIYLLLKLIFWQRFAMGTAPLLIGLFFFFSIILFFLGLLGEYILAIHTKLMNRPLVVEKERVNFNTGK